MSIQEKHLEDFKKIHAEILDFLEKDEKSEEDFQNLIDLIDELNIRNNEHNLTLFLQLISSISKNYHRNSFFIDKIEQILRNLEKDIKQNLTKSKIFKIFKGNKRILLFLFEEKFLIMDRYIIQILNTEKYLKSNYPEYFAPEIKPFISEKWFPTNNLLERISFEIPDNFNELRKEGENDNYICELIRKDSIDEFVQYVNKKNYSIGSTIESSIFETNSFLIKKQIESNESQNKLTLIKYALFFGSFQIFKYLQLNGVEFTPELFKYAIHGKNAEIIHILEENQKNNQNEINEYLEESIKCHHNDITNYLLDKYFRIEEKDSNRFLIQNIKYYNFQFIQNEKINENSILYICQYNYYSLLNILLNEKKIDVNKIILEYFNSIQNYIFQWNSKLYISIPFKIIYFNYIQNYIFQ